MSWTVSNLQRPFREDFSLQKSGIIAEKGAQIFGRRFVGFDRPKKAAPFSISKRALAAASEIAGRRRPLRPYFFTTGGSLTSVIVVDYPEDGETTIPAELQYVEIISVTASTGYDANTGEAKGDEKKLPSTVTFLVLPEQAKVLAELERVAKLHLALVYRGTADGARQFIEAQDALIEEVYAEPEKGPITLSPLSATAALRYWGCSNGRTSTALRPLRRSRW